MKILILALISNLAFADWTIVNPKTGKTMEFSIGDLKQFSGHALTLLQSKCPNISTSTIFELNKFIGKAIAEIDNPVPGDNPAFRENLIKSVTTCSNSISQTLSKPSVTLNKADCLCYNDRAEDTVEILRLPAKLTTTTTTTTTTIAPRKNPDPVPTLPVKKVEATTKKPENESRSFFQTVKAAIKTAYNWMARVVTKVTHFLGTLFGSLSIGRHRRSVGDEHSADDSVPISGNKHGGSATTHSKTNAQLSFRKLFDQACRIYCSKCSNHSPAPYEFKTASEKLLTHIFKIIPLQGIDLASEKHLTKDFMKSVVDCG